MIIFLTRILLTLLLYALFWGGGIALIHWAKAVDHLVVGGILLPFVLGVGAMLILYVWIWGYKE